MQKLNHIEHSNLARRLIETVGDLESAARICDLSKTALSTYQNPFKPETMPAKVISLLQVAGGTSLYSDAQRGEIDQLEIAVADPMHHACGLVKEAAEALGAIERAMADGVVSQADFTSCDRELADLEARIPIIRAGLREKLVRAT